MVLRLNIYIEVGFDVEMEIMFSFKLQFATFLMVIMRFLKSARSRWMEIIEAAHVTSRCLELMESAIQIDEIFY